MTLVQVECKGHVAALADGSATFVLSRSIVPPGENETNTE